MSLAGYKLPATAPTTRTCHTIVAGDRTYDAYLSYQSSNDKDRKFVVFKLLPFLEKKGFSVCIDQRDFIPGAGMLHYALI